MTVEINDFSTDNLLVRASEYFLFDDPVNDTVTIYVNRYSRGQLEIPMSRSEFLAIQSLDERRDFIAAKIRDALAANENKP